MLKAQKSWVTKSHRELTRNKRQLWPSPSVGLGGRAGMLLCIRPLCCPLFHRTNMGWVLEAVYMIISVVWDFFQKTRVCIFLQVICHFYYSNWVQFDLWIVSIDEGRPRYVPVPKTMVSHLPAPHFSITILLILLVIITQMCSSFFVVVIMTPKWVNGASSMWLATTEKWCRLSWMRGLNYYYRNN